MSHCFGSLPRVFHHCCSRPSIRQNPPPGADDVSACKSDRRDDPMTR